MSQGSDANGDAAFGWRPTSGSAEDTADGDGEDTEAASGSVAEAAPDSVAEAASGSGAEAASDSVAEAASGSEAEAASGSLAEAAPPPSASGSEDAGASELEELLGLVSATIGLSLGASSGEGEAGGLAEELEELDMMEPKNYGHSECHDE